LKATLEMSHATSKEAPAWIFGAVALAAIVVMLFVPRIPQDQAYHAFADTRTIASLPNFWNVISNVPFALAGLYGLYLTPRLFSFTYRTAYITFCLAVIAVAVGSGYYHLNPSTATLVWDRLPMSVAFMALFAATFADRVHHRLGLALLWPLVIIGAASVFYWGWTERHGVGDLRPYALVQFLPFALMVLMLLTRPGSRESGKWLWWAFVMYFLAKVTEHFDSSIYAAVGVGGHSIKHLLSAVAVIFATYALLNLEEPEPHLTRTRVRASST